MKSARSWARNPFLIRLLHWEYWSFTMVYIWIYPVWIFLSLRARSFFFFSASNPSIKNGGFLNESKKDICAIMPQHLYPRTIFFDAHTETPIVMRELEAANLTFPLIGKPDSGGRGRGVRLLRNSEDVMDYALHAVVDYHIQEFIEFEHEAGIFYYRYPGTARGKISGIVRKEFLKVTGNGVSTTRQLLQQDTRAILQLADLEIMYAKKLDDVLSAGETSVLVPYGNHARGAKFLDDTHLADEQLTQVIDDVCNQIPGFYYGRLDIKYNSWDELRQGDNFSVIEINGAGAEPTHIYDPAHSLFFAWKEIVRHWIILWRISRMNHKRGHAYMSVKDGIAMFREDELHSKMLARMPV